MTDDEPDLAWLAEHDPLDDDGESDPGEQPESAPEESEEEPEEPESSDEETTPDDTAGGSEPEPDADYERAIGALRRDGIPEVALASMDRDTLVQFGLKRAKVHGDVDSKLDSRSTEIQQLKEKLAGLESAKEPGTVESPGDPAGVTLEGPAKRLAEVLAVDVEAVEPILSEIAAAARQPLEAQVQALKEQLTQELAESQSLTRTTAEASLKSMVTQVRSELGDEFPGLAQGDAWSRVQTKMEVLAKNPAYQEIPDLEGRVRAVVRDAAWIELGPDMAKAAHDESETKRHARNKATLTVSKRSSDGPKGSPEEQASSLLARLEEKHGL